MPEYAEIRSQVEATAGRINGRFGEFDWVPLRYINCGFTRRTLAGFFRLSGVGLVTPLRDGMNLVAKEYVAAQSEDDPGVLVLSRLPGPPTSWTARSSSIRTIWRPSPRRCISA